MNSLPPLSLSLSRLYARRHGVQVARKNRSIVVRVRFDSCARIMLIEDVYSKEDILQ